MHTYLIDGEWLKPDSATPLEVINPTTLKAVGQVQGADAGLVPRAIEAAGAASGRLAALSPEERARELSAAAGRLVPQVAALAALVTAETGMPIVEAEDVVAVAVTRLRAPLQAPSPASRAGVHASVLSTDFALPGFVEELRAAVAEGQSGVWLLPPTAPLALLELLRLAGFPAGWVQALPADAASISALRAVPGLALATGAPAPLPRRAIFIANDADPEYAAQAVAAARLYNGGRLQVPVLRIHAEQAIAPAFADAIHATVAFLEMGDPAKRGTDLGPLHTALDANAVEAQVGALLRKRVTLKLGARRFKPWGLPGHFFQHTVLANVPFEELVAVGDIKGPVIAISTAEALAGACRAEQSLGGALDIELISRDPEAALARLDMPGLVLSGPGPVVADRLRRIDGGFAPDALVEEVLARSGLESPGGFAVGCRVRPLHARSTSWFPYAGR